MASKKSPKFIEFAGRASTSASYQGASLGRNVCVAVYDIGDDNVMLAVESNARRVTKIPTKTMTRDAYSDFCAIGNDLGVMVRALELFDCTTAWSHDDDK